MKGSDIINAFGGIDDDLIQDAIHHKRILPKWLKYTSLAACLACVVALTALSLNHLLQTPKTPGQALATASPTPMASPSPQLDSSAEPTPTASPTSAPTSAPASTALLPDPLETNRSARPIEDSLYWDSSSYPVRIHAPSRYESELYPDMDFSHEDYFIIYYRTAFTFVDTIARTPELDYTGLVWCITATPLNSPSDWSVLMNRNYCYMYNELLLGSDDTYMYTLVCPDPSYQCDFTDANALESYYQHLTDGLDMLNDFIVTNNLTEYDDWESRYTDWTLKAVENAQKALRGEPVPAEEQVWSARSLHFAGLVMNLPADMAANITTDEKTWSISLYEPISRQLLGGDGGLVFTISFYSYQEYCTRFGQKTADFTGDPLEASTYMLGNDGNDRVFVVSFPTDVRYDPNVPESIAAYRRYQADSKRILEDFCAIMNNDCIQNPLLDFSTLGD